LTCLFFLSFSSFLFFAAEGSIFFIYGIATFCRYLGAFAKYGWAWNRAPRRRSQRSAPPTAEMIECSVIFVYGASNTWLERTGAHAGDPYTTRQIQHISIAVMFWFAGLVGMALESRRVRLLLALSAFHPRSKALLPAPASPRCLRSGRSRSCTTSNNNNNNHNSGSSSNSSEKPGLGEPSSYTGSFNPFPALVIGVTGLAMAAHHQTYLYAVQVHSLWGNLLAAFAALRIATYVFLWLRPPTAERSVLPSRPPTEALASFFLACGGLTFIASTEQIEFAAMRSGHGAFLASVHSFSYSTRCPPD
jgi:hypothetical protein